MQIFFDWEIDNKVDQPVHKWVYEDIRTFLKERFKLLEEEIDRRTTGEMAFVLVMWNENGVEVRYYFIPDDLVAKMNETLTKNDMDYIMEMIEHKIDKKRSEN